MNNIFDKYYFKVDYWIGLIIRAKLIKIFEINNKVKILVIPVDAKDGEDELKSFITEIGEVRSIEFIKG